MFNKYNDCCCNVISTEKCCTDPVYEAPVENCVQKDYIHEVVQV